MVADHQGSRHQRASTVKLVAGDDGQVRLAGLSSQNRRRRNATRAEAGAAPPGKTKVQVRDGREHGRQAGEVNDCDYKD
jgi:hypothetical protein